MISYLGICHADLKINEGIVKNQNGMGQRCLKLFNLLKNMRSIAVDPEKTKVRLQ